MSVFSTTSDSLMNTYLQQQQQSLTQGGHDMHSTSLVLAQPSTDSISLEEFKNYVRKWLEIDNFIKKAQDVIKEKKKSRDDIAQLITRFMCKYNIEDLNTKEGRIRCKVNHVKAPINQKLIKQRINEYIDNEDKKQELLSKIYEEREVSEKVSLRRLKIT